jgi:multidrug efflux pump subunit AcrA (membrane-fusion protein)
VQSNADFVQNKRFNSSLASTLASTDSLDTIAQIRGNLEGYLANCPRGYEWQGMSVADCISYRQFLNELATRRTTEINRWQAANQAEAALRDADNAAEAATAQVANVQQQLDYARQQRQQVSIFNPDMIKLRLGIAGATLLSTLFSIILLVWFGATAIDLFNWVILMMRSAEKTQQAKLESLRTQP